MCIINMLFHGIHLGSKIYAVFLLNIFIFCFEITTQSFHETSIKNQFIEKTTCMMSNMKSDSPKCDVCVIHTLIVAANCCDDGCVFDVSHYLIKLFHKVLRYSSKFIIQAII